MCDRKEVEARWLDFKEKCQGEMGPEWETDRGQRIQGSV